MLTNKQLEEGTHVVELSAQDTSINRWSVQENWTFTLDSIAPDVPIVATLPTFVNTSPIVVDGTAEAEHCTQWWSPHPMK